MMRILLLVVVVLINLPISPCFALGLSAQHVNFKPVALSNNLVINSTQFDLGYQSDLRVQPPFVIPSSLVNYNRSNSDSKLSKVAPYLGAVVGVVVGLQAGIMASDLIMGDCTDESECEFHWSLLLLPVGAIAGGVVGFQIGKKF